jgi:hypothetical protein
MLKKLLLTTVSAFTICAPGALAQFDGAPGGFNPGFQGPSLPQPQMPMVPMPQAPMPSVGGVVANVLSNLMMTQPTSTGAMRNGLPATTTDSFVYQAAGQAELIYGDEGVYDIPPDFEFTKDHRIAAGIFGQRDAGLTTGHGSLLPDAWGGDEFVKGPEFDVSGPTMGNYTDPLQQLLGNVGLGGVTPLVESGIQSAVQPQVSPF